MSALDVGRRTIERVKEAYGRGADEEDWTALELVQAVGSWLEIADLDAQKVAASEAVRMRSSRASFRSCCWSSAGLSAYERRAV
jgi:hypothetical protein